MNPRSPRSIYRWLTGFAALSLLAVFTFRAQPVAGAVELIYFQGTVQEDGVLLEWETATEFNNVGFYVYASDSGDENDLYEPVSGFIPTQGGGISGAEYTYLHEEVTAGVTYHYKLQSLDSNQSGEFSNVIEVQIPATWGPTATLTPTSTATGTGVPGEDPTETPTPTQTATTTTTSSTSRTSTPRPSSTPFWTSTPPPSGFRTNTPAPSQTAVPTGTPQATSVASVLNSDATLPPGEPTATLLPLPSVTIEFPQLAAVEPREALPGVEGAERQEDGRSSSPVRYLPIALVGLLWLLLGGWFLYSLRRFDQ